MKNKILALTISFFLSTSSMAANDISGQLGKFNDLLDSGTADSGFPPLNDTQNTNVVGNNSYYGSWSGYNAKINANTTLVLNQDGTYLLSAGSQSYQGTYVIANDNLILNVFGNQITVKCVLHGNTLTLDNLVLTRQTSGGSAHSGGNLDSLFQSQQQPSFQPQQQSSNAASKLKGKWLLTNLSGAPVNTGMLNMVLTISDSEFSIVGNGNYVACAGTYQASDNGDFIMNLTRGDNAGKTIVNKWDLNNDILTLTLSGSSDTMSYRRIN